MDVRLVEEDSVTIPVTKEPARRTEGYDCEFVQQPPDVIQTECPICLQLLCKPHLVSCCCRKFCKSCIEKVKCDGKACPLCNEQGFTLMHEKDLERTLNGFEVYCTYQSKGCDWKGELGQLNRHLNFNEPQDRTKGCMFAELQCIHCKGYTTRRVITTHEDECPERPYSCDYCHDYSSTLEDVKRRHWRVCKFRPVPCPHECGVYPERQNLEYHILNECSMTVVDCEFQHVGCEVSLPRKDMMDHMNENLASHMVLLAYTSKTQLQRIKELEKENEVLKHKVAELHRVCMPVPPCEFVLDHYSVHKCVKDQWFSPPFYSHRGGYKLCLGMNFAFNLISVYIMQGEFDEHLTWPFQGGITVQFFDHQKNQYSTFCDFVNISGGRVASREDRNSLRGTLFSLSSKWCKNDSLNIRILKVVVYC